MSLGALIIKYYHYGLYQPENPSPDPKISLIQSSLDIVDSPFSLS